MRPRCRARPIVILSEGMQKFPAMSGKSFRCPQALSARGAGSAVASDGCPPPAITAEEHSLVFLLAFLALHHLLVLGAPFWSLKRHGRNPPPAPTNMQMVCQHTRWSAVVRTNCSATKNTRGVMSPARVRFLPESKREAASGFPQGSSLKARRQSRSSAARRLARCPCRGMLCRSRSDSIRRSRSVR